MRKRLGSNPLENIQIKSRREKKVQKLSDREEVKKCIFLRYQSVSSGYYCTSPRSRLHGLLGDKNEAIKKCSTCHVAKF